jgi:hypothetical protein
MDRRSFLKAGAASSLASLSGTGLALTAISRQDLVGDVAILREAIKLHPGLYRYNSSSQIQARLEAFEREWLSVPDVDGRYLALSRFTAQIRCGHSYANFFNQKKAVQSQLFDRPTRLPFHFVWIGNEMTVTSDSTGTLPRGTVIQWLNGQTPVQIRNTLLPYVRADGSNNAKCVSLLEVRGDDTIETFDVLQGLLAPPRGGEHVIEARLPTGQVKKLGMPAIGLAARQKAMTGNNPESDVALWDWHVRHDGTAVLTMPGWAVWNSKWDWKAWLDDRLDSLAGSKGLVVDLRDNEGGADCGDAILARVISNTYVPSAWQQRLRFRRTPAKLDKYLDTWDVSFRSLGANAKPLSDGFYLRPAADDQLAIEPSPKRLGVPMVVLTSPVNSSATFQFASNVRALGAGRLVGGQTGGNQRGINGGCFFFVRLPASGLEFDLPLVGYFATSRQPDAGLIPDYEVTTTSRDLAAGRDPILGRAVALLI